MVEDIPGLVMPAPGVVEPGPIEPGVIEPGIVDPGMVEPGVIECMPVALFMLLGPESAEGEPAELDMPDTPPPFMPVGAPVTVACEGFALAGEVEVIEDGEPIDPPVPPAADEEPEPMVCA